MPLSYLVQCDGENCEREDRAQFDPQRGYSAPGWCVFGNKTFCSYLCLATWAAAQAAAQASQMQEALNGAAEEQPVG